MINFYDRTAYHLYILDIPGLRGKELISAIRFKLNSLYPGNIDDRNIKLIKNGNKKWSYLVFVLDKNTGNKMLLLSPLFVRHKHQQETVNVLFIAENWLEYICIDNGVIVSTIVKLRKENSFIDDIKELCDTDNKIIIYCDDSERQLFDKIDNDGRISFFDKEKEIHKIDVHKISLFSEKSPAIKMRRILGGILLLVLMVTGTVLFYQYREKENERNTALRLEMEYLEREKKQKQEEENKLITLKNQYHEMVSLRTATPFDIAAIIAECSNLQTRIQSATFNGNFFQIEGLTDNSLELLRRFEEHWLVRDARLHQVHPGKPRDTFTLSGKVVLEPVKVDEELFAVSEQIDIYESLIEEEKRFTVLEYPLTPSLFGESVNTLFKKWGCTVNSFQFMNEPQRTEIEYSLRGSGSSFFNALYEIKNSYPSWDVHLTQIRNLYPRNILDVVLRIRTEYHLPDTVGVQPSTGEATTPYPIANISRNYFPPIPPSSQLSVSAVPQTISVPARAERVTWLEFVGTVRENNGNRYIYVKNTRTGSILRLIEAAEGNMRFNTGNTGNFIIFIDDNIYEIVRR